MKKLMLVLLSCVGLSSCVVVPERTVRIDREVYSAAPATTYYYPSYYTYRQYPY